MKLKYILSALLFGAVSLSSCSDFLEETPYNKIVPGGDFYTTFDGITGGVNGLYAGLRKLYITESFMNVCENETDITIFPNSIGRQPVNASTGYVTNLWNTCYININQCNEVIYALNNYEIEDLTDDMKKRYLGEARFIRGLLYSHLVKQWGDVPLKLTPTNEADTYAVRTKEEDVWKAVIEDLEYAKDNLPKEYKDKANDYGRATCWAAMHELCKCLLTCKREDPAAQKIALDYAEKIINSGQFQLMSSTYNLWSMDYVRDNKEVIFPVCYSKDYLLNGDGNQSHMYFVADYTRYHKGMTRTIEYGRPWIRCKPTLYAYKLFYVEKGKNKNGQIANGSADTRAKDYFMWQFNKCTSGTYSEFIYNHTTNKVEEQVIPRASGKPYPGGENVTMVCFPWYCDLEDIDDAGIIRIKKEIRALWPIRVYLPENMQAKVEATGGIESASNPYDASNPDDKWPSNVYFNDIFFYPYLRKHLDPTRPDPNYAQGTRDVFVSRLADTYLLAAEAALLLNDKDKAVDYVNKVRERAAAVNSKDAVETENNKKKMQVTADELDFDYLLDERGRELIGEMHRWYDLKRFGKLTERMTRPNDIWYFEPAYKYEKYLEKRPYPRDFLMSISNPQDFKNDERYGN